MESSERYEQTEKAGLFRDTKTGAIINRDTKSLRAYKKRKENANRVKEHEEKIRKMEQSLSALESNLSEIKELLVNERRND
jgi:hypothetical protein